MVHTQGMDENANTLGRVLRSRREQAGVTRKSLAQRANVGLRTLQELETGKRWNDEPYLPSLRTLIAVCGALGVSVATVAREAGL